MTTTPPLVCIRWHDAHGDATRVVDRRTLVEYHQPLVVDTVGWLLGDRDGGVSVANERLIEDGHVSSWRGHSFIPRPMLQQILTLPAAAPPVSPEPSAPAGAPSGEALSFDAFVGRVHAMLEARANHKGYHAGSADAPNRLYEFVAGLARGPGHAIGEIIYKATRYASARDPEDLVKIAAWAFLIWRHRDGG